MMRLEKTLVWIVAACLVAGLLSGVATARDLGEILDQIETHGGRLDSMRARVVQRRWTDILEEFDDGEEGQFLFLRHQGEVFLRRDISRPQTSHLVIGDGVLTFYQPRIKQAQRHNLGKNKDKAEYLLLGFGTTREVLEEAWEIRLLGEEELDGRRTWMLELTPRSDQVSAFFSKIVLWVEEERWIPVQQKLVEPTDDYMLVSFHDIELNPSLSRKDFDLKIPKGTQVIGP